MERLKRPGPRAPERPTTDRPPLPPRQRRAFSTLTGPVDTAGAADEAAALGKLFKVSPGLARALTHGFHSYAGRMHPSIARGAIQRWSRKGGTVLDPFCGSGTVLVEAQVAGRLAIGIDASPLAVSLSRVRTNPLTAEKRVHLVAAAHEVAEAAEELARKRQRPDVPAWAKQEFKAFHPHVAFELLGLRELVMDTAEDEIGLALRMVLSSMLVKFMRAGPEAPRDGESKRIGRGVPSRFFAARTEELARGLSTLEEATPKGTPRPRVSSGDARAYPDVAAAGVDLIVSSPPYAGTYDYAGQHAVRFRWLDLEDKSFRSRQLGDRERGLGAASGHWREGRRRWLGEMARVLRPGGHAVLVVGDGVVGDHAEDAAEAVRVDAERAGLAPVARASQDRPIHDKRLRDIFAGRPHREHIVLLRR